MQNCLDDGDSGGPLYTTEFSRILLQPVPLEVGAGIGVIFSPTNGCPTNPLDLGDPLGDPPHRAWRFDQGSYGGTLAGDSARACAWLVRGSGEVFSFNEPYGLRVEFDPPRLVDERDGSVVAQEGDEVVFSEPTFFWQGRAPVCRLADPRGHIRLGELIMVVPDAGNEPG